jgi:hypothetical protein
MSVGLILVLPALFLAMGVWACVAQEKGHLTTGSSAPVQFVDVEKMDDGFLGIGPQGQDLVHHFLNELEVAGGAVEEGHHRSSTRITVRFGDIETRAGVGEVLGGVEVWKLSTTTIKISRNLRHHISYENSNQDNGTEVMVGRVIGPDDNVYAVCRANL